jgi:MtN3 and saliva related transmembrane protein
VSKQLVTILSFAAAILTTSAFIPQVVRTWKTRSTEDFSWAWVAMFATGVTLWLTYGLLKKDPAIIGANGVTLALVLSMAWVKMRDK